MKKRLLRSLFALTVLASMLLASSSVLAANTQFSQVINQGVLGFDIVDATGASVPSPAVSFSAVTFDYDNQNSTATLGDASQLLRVSNRTTTASWDLTIAASSPTDLWDDGTNTFDYNDTTGASLTVDPSVGTIAPTNSYTATGVSLGSSATFDEGTVDSVTLMSADGTAEAPGRWDLTGIGLTQVIPGGQAPGTYTLDMVLTAS